MNITVARIVPDRQIDAKKIQTELLGVLEDAIRSGPMAVTDYTGKIKFIFIGTEIYELKVAKFKNVVKYMKGQTLGAALDMFPELTEEDTEHES